MRVLQNRDVDSRRFGAAQTQAIVPQPNLHRIAEWGEAEDFDFLAFVDAHFEHSLNERVVPIDGVDTGALAGKKVVERGHVLYPATGRTRI